MSNADASGVPAEFGGSECAKTVRVALKAAIDANVLKVRLFASIPSSQGGMSAVPLPFRDQILAGSGSEICAQLAFVADWPAVTIT